MYCITNIIIKIYNNVFWEGFVLEIEFYISESVLIIMYICIVI